MRMSLLTIPLEESFLDEEGNIPDSCPICRMRNTIELHLVEYITGAAMMEPDVREETNSLGFCERHCNDILAQNVRLPVGILLNTLLLTNKDEFFKSPSLSQNILSKGNHLVKGFGNTCFVCKYIEEGMKQITRTLFIEYEKDGDFRNLFSRQKCFCIPHYNYLLSYLDTLTKKYKQRKEFSAALKKVTEKYWASLIEDTKAFTESFDYHNIGILLSPEAKNSLFRTVEFLTSRKPAERKDYS